MSVRIASKLAMAAVLFGAVACGPGSAYDGLVGGTTEDASLDAPRPISPLSISLVATSRPRLRWELSGTATGAVVEMCRTRACDGDVKRFEAKGRELVVPEDLEPGIWFWRLLARDEAKTGTKTSSTWEMLVRGPAAHGSSDAPVGSLVDYDGDGRPDLVAVANIDDGMDAPWPGLVGFVGGEGGALDFDMKTMFPLIGYQADTPFVALGGGSDFDGDGYADMVVGGSDQDGGFLEFHYGGATPFDVNKLGYFDGVFHGAMSAREAGDFDGDGYGDVMAGDPITATVHLGSAKGPSSLVSITGLPSAGDVVPPKTARALAIGAAFDSNGDGLSELAFGIPMWAADGESRFTRPMLETDGPSLHGGAAASAQASDEALAQYPDLVVAPGTASRDVSPTSAREVTLAKVHAKLPQVIAFASGDFDGDGRADLAATVSLDDSSRRVCVFFGDADRVVSDGTCVAGAAYDGLLGESLATGDLEGDGTDELLAASSEDGASVKVLRWDGTKLRAAEKIPSLGATLTTIWPGRPGKARWAARSADGHTVKVFEGTSLVQTLRPPPEAAADFGRAMR